MNKKSTLRSVANDYLTHPKSNSGITLIALVITIVLNAVAWSKERKNLLKYNKTLANIVNPL